MANGGTQIGVLGPEGSHSFALLEQWQAHPQWQPWCQQHQVTPVAYPSLHTLLAAYNNGDIPLLLVPAENALEGSITETLEALFQHTDDSPRILAEFHWPVKHALIQKNKNSATPKHIVSHPQALGQCRQTLLEAFGHQLTFHAATSTSEGVRLLAEQPDDWAAIGSAAAAKQYGMAIHTPNVSDANNNVTRFWLVASPSSDAEGLKPLPEPPKQTDANSLPTIRTSLCMGLQDRPGVLVDALLVLKAYGLTMTRIESRPARKRMGDYVFYIDVAANVHATEHERVHMYLQADSARLCLSSAYHAWPVFTANLNL